MSQDYQKIAISPELHTKVKIHAAQDGVSMKEFTERALLFYMERPRTVADFGRDYREGDSTDGR